MPGLIRRLITPQRSQANVRERDRDLVRRGHGRDGTEDLTDSCDELSSCCAKKSTQRRANSTKSRLPVPKQKAVSAARITIQRVPDIYRADNTIPPLPTPRLRAPSISSSCYEGRNAALEALTGSAPTHRRPAPAPVLCPVEHGQVHPHSYQYSHSSNSSRYLRPPRSKNDPIGLVNVIADNSNLEIPSPGASTLSLSDYGADEYEVGPTDWQPAQPMYDGQSLDSSDTVDRLFRETDEAFKALGSALRETQRASQLSDLPSPPSPPGIPTLHKHSKSMPLPNGFPKQSRMRGEDSHSFSSPRSSPDRRSSIVKKPQKKKHHLAGPNAFTKAAIRTPRWTLSENVTDILTGQRFRRIEADEMLTPDRIEAVRRKREAAQLLDEEREEREERRGRYSIDSVRSVASDNSETDNEPFHLEKLYSQIRARPAAENAVVETIPPAPELIPDVDVVSRDFSKQNSVVGDNDSIGSARDKTDTSPDVSPQLPTKNPVRTGTEAIEKLPSIPEAMATTTETARPHSEPLPGTTAPGIVDLNEDENDEYFYLKSTPYTLTKPSFRHGPITLSKAEAGKGAKTMDDTLDWTAFQMAILGGAGDLLQDMTCEEDTKQVEEITSWFDTFGFETYGVLVPEEMPEPESEPEPTPSMRSSAHSTLSSTPSTANTDIDLPIPVGAEFPSGFWNAPAPGQALDQAKFFNSTGLKRWVGEKGPKRRPTSNSPEGSLPPSPMMPLVIHLGDGEDDIPNAIPMGYNLGHDLGDFLKWEAENVYASGFSLSP